MHTDIPTRSEIEAFLAAEGPSCEKLYTPTSPLAQEGRGGRIAFKNQVAAAAALLRDAGNAEDDVHALEESLGDLEQDYDFWSVQADSLAVFAPPAQVRASRLPNRIAEAVRVGDSFSVKPLLRTVSFPQAAFVLALAQNDIRLVEIAPDAPPFDVPVADLPSGVAGAAGKAGRGDRATSSRMQGGEGHKVRLRQYARGVDCALRAVLAGRDQSLILACTPQLDSIFLVDMDAHVAGTVDASDGRAVLTPDADDEIAGVTEEIAPRTVQTRGRVVAVRADDLPGASPVAAILRHAI